MKTQDIIAVCIAVLIFIIGGSYVVYTKGMMEHHIPKYAWEYSDTIVFTCPGTNLELIEYVESQLPFELALIVPTESCHCSAEKMLNKTERPAVGSIEVISFDIPDELKLGGRTAYTFNQDGEIIGACVLIPKEHEDIEVDLSKEIDDYEGFVRDILLIVAHELSHACGNKHVEDKNGILTFIQDHLMSTHVGITSSNTYGMDLSCDEARE